jgi:hypothetical protein
MFWEYRTIYAFDGRKLIMAYPKGETSAQIEARAFAALFPVADINTIRQSTGLNWPVLTGLAYPTKALCRAESPNRGHHT